MSHVDPHRAAGWPKFAPLTQTGSLVFLTFGSRLDYGVILVNAPNPQLWITAIDLGVAAAGREDPSRPPAWLPFQNVQEKNHAGVWATR